MMDSQKNIQVRIKRRELLTLSDRTHSYVFRLLFVAWKKTALFFETVKFEHSIFALPFAVLSTFQISGGLPDWGKFGLIVLAMIGMRTVGMAANRLIDMRIDAINPRTAGRALPTGRVTQKEVMTYIAVSLTAYGVAVVLLNPVVWSLAVIPAVIMILYPYLKRFTWLAHFGVGVIYLIVPSAVALAFTGELPAGFIWLGFAGMAWVSGFDILYATSDTSFDKREGLHSIPARFSIDKALWAARSLHAVSAIFMFVSGLALGGGILYYTGALLATALLTYENLLIKPSDLSRLNVAFFNMNGIIAVVFCVFVCLDSVLKI